MLHRARCLESMRGRAGASVVEFAIVVPVFFAFIIGIIEVGRGMMVNHLLLNAAREGCRTGVLSGKTTSDITGRVSSVLSTQGVSGITTTVTVNSQSVDASTAVSNDEISVTVSVPVANVTWVPGMHFLSGTLRGKYSLRRE